MGKRMIMGLTGLYCAGKNYASLLLEKRGIPVLDADKLGHEVIRRETEKIALRFGKEILDTEGFIDRKRLGKLTFGNPAELAALEAIIHPAVNSLTEEWLERQELQFRTDHGTGESFLCVINAALLHKSSFYNRLKAIITVSAPGFVRLYRAVKRDKLPLGELYRRFRSQKEFPRYKTGKNGPQLFSSTADIYTIQNSGFPGSLRSLERQIDAILEGINYGKEKIVDGRSIGGGVSGYRSKRRDTGF